MPHRCAGIATPLHPAADVGNHGVFDIGARERFGIGAVVARIERGHEVRMVIRLAADHHAVDLREMRVDLLQRLHAAVEQDFQVREVALELVDDLVAQRRDLAVLLRAQSLEDGIARVDDEGLSLLYTSPSPRDHG